MSTKEWTGAAAGRRGADGVPLVESPFGREALPNGQTGLASKKKPGRQNGRVSRLGRLLDLDEGDVVQGAVKALGDAKEGDGVAMPHGTRRTISQGQGSRPSTPERSHFASGGGPNRHQGNPDPMSHPNRTGSQAIPTRATQDSHFRCRRLTPLPVPLHPEFPPSCQVGSMAGISRRR